MIDPFTGKAVLEAKKAGRLIDRLPARCPSPECVCPCRPAREASSS
jgi:hypothetical protein